MPLTPLQAAVLDHFKHRPVATLGQLRSALNLSHLTVFRVLKQHGYFSSFNHNLGLAEKWEQARQASSQREEQQIYAIVLAHVRRYEGKLAYEGDSPLNEEGDRTTNALEQRWRQTKRCCRVRHGRAKLVRDRRVLPATALLVGNLAIEEYVKVVVGSLAQLPERLAEVGSSVPPFRGGKSAQTLEKIGPLPRSWLRQDNFLEELLAVCPPPEE